MKLGESVALEVHYAATPEDAQATGLPPLPGAFVNGENLADGAARVRAGGRHGVRPGKRQPGTQRPGGRAPL